MKRQILLIPLLILFLSISSVYATDTNEKEEQKDTKCEKVMDNISQHSPDCESTAMDCTGKFTIDGDTYTITLHDVSLWTCAKFKVASWFN